MTIGSGALTRFPVTWASRVELPGGKTSPEELIAAAHAACYSMAFSAELEGRGAAPEHLDVAAVATIDDDAGDLKISTMELTVRGKVPGMSEVDFLAAAKAAGVGCPVSKALAGNVAVTLDAKLVR